MSIWVLEDEAHAEPIGEFSSFDKAETELKRRLSLPKTHNLNRGPCSNPDCPRTYRIIEYNNSRVPWEYIQKTEIFTPV